MKPTSPALPPTRIDTAVAHPVPHLAAFDERVVDAGQVGFGEHEIRRRPRGRRPVGADADPHVGEPDRRRVVRAVAGHRHHAPAARSASTIRTFCSGETRAKMLVSAARSTLLLVCHSFQLCPCGHVVCRQAHLAGDGGGGGRMVSGDHHRPDPRVDHALHRLAGIVTGRVSDPQDADERELVHQGVRVLATVREAGRALGDRQKPQAPFGQLVHGILGLAAALLIKATCPAAVAAGDRGA